MNGNLAYQDPPREELIDGKIVAMSPCPAFNHNQVAYNIATLFANYLKGKTCTPIADGMALFLDEDNYFIPDFMVVCDPQKIQSDGVHGAPDLVVEVLSPGSIRYDRRRKKELYAKHGVKEYWIVSPLDHAIEVYYLDGADFTLHDAFARHPDCDLPRMSEKERAEVVTSFQCSLFDDLDIALDDVFYRTF